MNPLITSAFLALRSVFAPGMMVIFIWSVLLAIGVLGGFIAGTGMAVDWFAQTMQNQWLAPYMSWLGGIGATMLAWFLFPGIMPVIINFFDDRIAHIIERQDYPGVIQPTQQPFWPELWHDVRFTCMAILLNILVLPLYLLPGLNLFLFYLLNGYLLGREFFIMAARRHMPVEQAEVMRKRYGRSILIAGIGLVLLATLPILNLFAPFWGIAVMVHLFHRLEKPPMPNPMKLE